MARLTKDFTQFTRGNDVELLFNFPVLWIAGAGVARLIVKLAINDADGAAVIDKTITTVLTGNGQITDTGASDGQAAALFKLTKAETSALVAGIDYVFDLEVSDGALFDTPIGGKIRLAERIRTAIG